jgi:hypothetical protein
MKERSRKRQPIVFGGFKKYIQGGGGEMQAKTFGGFPWHLSATKKHLRHFSRCIAHHAQFCKHWIGLARLR